MKLNKQYKPTLLSVRLIVLDVNNHHPEIVWPRTAVLSSTVKSPILKLEDVGPQQPQYQKPKHTAMGSLPAGTNVER